MTDQLDLSEARGSGHIFFADLGGQLDPRRADYTDEFGGRWHIHRDPPPIPARHADWQWYHEDFDGPGDRRWGYSATLDEAIADIDCLADELDQETAP